ncbi:MAG: hypothetical protein RLZZ77_2074 [Bacteroidota bacterium]|jgi:tetratricopeptide (TPR) repeat protein
MKHIYTLLFSALVLVSACQTSKHFTKLGAKQEEAGLVNEAAASYYSALVKKRNNVDAQIGMKKTGQLVLNNLLSEFSRNASFGTKKDAVYSFHTARDYRDKIRGVGIELQLADFYITDYEKTKSAYLTDLYNEGTTLLEQEKYKDAEVKFNEIKRLDPNFKDAQDLGEMAVLEPLYISGNSEFNLGHYRAAYGYFNQITTKRSDYKDVVDLKKKCIEKGRYTIALLPFNNATTTPGLDARISAYALEALTSINDPFLRIVDRENMQAILQEQKLQLSGVIDDATAVEVGELVGAQAILTGTVINYSVKTGLMRPAQRNAYASYSVKKLNEVDGKYYFETRYKPTTYTEYYNNSSCTIGFQYKLINLSTGEILQTEILNKTANDEILYARYEGNANELFPASANGVNMNPNDRQALMTMLNGRQQLKSGDDLANNLLIEIGGQLSKQIGMKVTQIVK